MIEEPLIDRITSYHMIIRHDLQKDMCVDMMMPSYTAFCNNNNTYSSHTTWFSVVTAPYRLTVLTKSWIRIKLSIMQ